MLKYYAIMYGPNCEFLYEVIFVSAEDAWEEAGKFECNVDVEEVYVAT